MTTSRASWQLAVLQGSHQVLEPGTILIADTHQHTVSLYYLGLHGLLAAIDGGDFTDAVGITASLFMQLK